MDLTESNVAIYMISIGSTLFTYTGVTAIFYNFYIFEKYYEISWLQIEVTLMSILFLILTIGSFLGFTQPGGLTVAAVSKVVYIYIYIR